MNKLIGIIRKTFLHSSVPSKALKKYRLSCDPILSFYFLFVFINILVF